MPKPDLKRQIEDARRNIQASIAAGQSKIITQLAATVRELLATPDLSMESLEPETVRAIDKAEALLKRLRL